MPLRSKSAALKGAPSHDLTPAQRRGVVGVMVVLHAMALWAVLQVPGAGHATVSVAPLFVDLLTPPAPTLTPTPPPAAQPVIKNAPPALLAAPAVAKPTHVEAAPVPEPLAPVAPWTPAQETAPTAPAAASMAVRAPSLIPASEVQYVVRPVPQYPKLAVRLREAGTVVVRVFIDEAGAPGQARIEQSSGHARLDEAALASLTRARFKPYTQHGVPTAGWARIPIPFELENE